METAVIVVLLASALAFFVGFFVALCNDNKRPHVTEYRSLKLLRALPKEEAQPANRDSRRSA